MTILKIFLEDSSIKNLFIGHLYHAILSEHNRIAERLSQLNQHWDDGKLYLEARRAVVAQLQHVTFNEFASDVLGETGHSDAELRPVSGGFYTGYSSTHHGGAIDAVVLAALPALTSMRRTESSSLEQQVMMAANSVNFDVRDHDSLHGWDMSTLLLHASRDYGLPSYAKFVTRCSGDVVKVSYQNTTFYNVLVKNVLNGI